VTSLNGKTLFITGASRGIGLAIAVRAARDGANIAVAAKTTAPDPRLEGTIYTAAEAIGKAGGRALALACDIRDESQVRRAVAQAAEHFGGIDICVNNASAISLAPIDKTEPKRFDLMFQVNTRGTFVTTQACLPFLRQAANPHVLMLSPPLDMNPRWFTGQVAYSITKFGMSLCVLGLAEELKMDGIAVNALWPRSAIATAAVRNVLGGEELIRMSRKPDIVADAAHLVFAQPAREFTGKFLIDDTFLYETGGVRDFDPYRVDPTAPLASDFFVPEDSAPPPGVTISKFPFSAERKSGGPQV
jgi:citronellol/citronellal dehydrogenase